MKKVLYLFTTLPSPEVMVCEKNGFRKINEEYQAATWLTFEKVTFKEIAQAPFTKN